MNSVSASHTPHSATLTFDSPTTRFATILQQRKGRPLALMSHSDDSHDLANHVFPNSFSRVRLYIYPWLNSTELAASADDRDYGSNDLIPKGAHDSPPQLRAAAGGAPGGNPRLWDVVYTVEAKISSRFRNMRTPPPTAPNRMLFPHCCRLRVQHRPTSIRQALQQVCLLPEHV